MPADPWLVLAAAAIEAGLGYPRWLQRSVPHPVVWIGSVISGLDKAWNHDGATSPTRRAMGVVTLALIMMISALAGRLPDLAPGPMDLVLVVLIGTTGLALRSLFDHVNAVARPLAAGDLAGARTAVGAIVGRDVADLDASGVASAALESLAESFNDGVVAPIFWFVVGGLPGLLVYKTVNTADSMIGHREPRWRDFGWASARMDDLMNLIPARIAAGLIVLVGGGGWRVMVRDAGKHASPNSGWPEAAMAGALGIRLGGPVAYDGVVASRPTFGEGATATARDLERGLKLYVKACALLLSALAVGGLAWPR